MKQYQFVIPYRRMIQKASISLRYAQGDKPGNFPLAILFNG